MGLEINDYSPISLAQNRFLYTAIIHIRIEIKYIRYGNLPNDQLHWNTTKQQN